MKSFFQEEAQYHPGLLSLGVKRPGSEADHSPPSSAEVKECVELYLHSPNTLSWRGAQLKHRGFVFERRVLSGTERCPGHVANLEISSAVIGAKCL
jgi:hypothetical protein